MRFVLIGNAENRRVAFFQDALRRCELPPATMVSWLDVIADRVAWDDLLHEPAVLRLESPGENFAVEKALLAAGASVDDEQEHASRISACAAAELREDRGRIWYPRQWYLGFRDVLRRFDARLNSFSGLRRVQSFEDVLTHFDKVECQRQLAAASVPVPFSLGAIGSYDELLARMDATGHDRVFVKLAHGSSASGVVAYERSRARQQAHTSAEIVRTGGELRLYNSLKVRRYQDAADIAPLIDTLARERVQVEAWIPKASVNGKRFDLRVVVTDGRAGHTVVRTSSSPMTNLHLGNARGDPDDVIARIGAANYQSALETCEQAMRVFPSTLYAGIDLLIQTDLTRHAVLEINAFGDLLPNVLHEGRSTYEAQLAALGSPVLRAGAAG